MFTTGTRVGNYEITGVLGAGGMGEVYRARDSRLKREVALKVLPPSFAEDPGRLARFRREAEVLAALDHPHIAAIYGLEEAPEATALVLQLVDGETLANHIDREGALPPADVERIAGQIADALAAAHARGIVHRDLKPSNLVMTPGGIVKVLDFGLAKLTDPQTISAVDLAMSPTVTSPAMMTGAGVLLGTAAYMSPEQAKGKVADKRSDVWAFGCVVYEMLTGDRPHKGDSVSETVASILKEAPDLHRVPYRFRRLVRSCLQKDPEARLHDIADWQLLLDDEPLGSPAAVVRPGRRWFWPSVAGALLVAVVALAALLLTRPSPAADEIRAQIPKPEGLTFVPGTQAAISPDGKWISFPATGPDNIPRMYVRALSSLEVMPLPGSEGIIGNAPPPFWSFDSRYVVYGALGKLLKSEVTGTPAQVIAETGVPFVQGGAWNPQGDIIYGRNTSWLERVTATGGKPVPLTVLRRGDLAHRYPQFLPDGRRFIYLRASADPARSGIYIGSLDTKPEDQSDTQILPTNRQAWWVSAPGGATYLLTQRDDVLLAQRFDTESGSVSGEPVLVASGVGSIAGPTAGLWSIARTGSLIYRGGGGGLPQLTWMDLTGKSVGTLAGPGDYGAPSISPDGQSAAIRLADSQGRNIWVYDLRRDKASKLTFGGSEEVPVWSYDGRRVFYSASRGGRRDLFQKSADGLGEEELVYKSEFDKTPQGVTPDGKYLLFSSQSEKTDEDLWFLPLGTQNPQPVLFTNSAGREYSARVSPDGRWVAYLDNSPGTPELYVRPLSTEAARGNAGQGTRWLVSSLAINPNWSRDSGRLMFQGLNGEVQYVEVESTVTWRTGPIRRLLGPIPLAGWILNPSTNRLLQLQPSGSGGPPPPFTLVLNWMSRLPR